MDRLSHRLRLRWPYLLMYCCLTATGVIVGLSPSDAVREQLRAFLLVWVIFFILGGVSSALGVVGKSWLGEAFGLPLLSSALAIYGIILIWRYSVEVNASPAFLAFGLLLLGFGLGLYARWQEVMKLLRIAREMNDGR